MKKFLKIALWTIGVIIVLLVGAASLFMYKVKNGFPVSYETEKPAIEIPKDQKTVLLFSKSTGFRHGESIEAGKKAFTEMASLHHWFLYNTEDGGVFNPEQLAQFDVVIFNNSTGRVLNEDQQAAVQSYVENGGTLLGIHGSGDNSHHWEWYEQNFIGAEFSHHPLNPQLQAAEIMLNPVPDSLLMVGLPQSWTHTDEWYIFFENPRDRGFNVLYNIDGDKIIPDGNILWTKDKNFGMGKDHPVAWYKSIGSGRTFYTSIGHNGEAWQQLAFLKMLENVITGESVRR